ncbi:hypothetical protein BDF19DRAFT_470384 [Syncephalis fuscata]|nr:hypothetical protein BDF19DRAFT_470384 [Syncephalis fuscata]
MAAKEARGFIPSFATLRLLMRRMIKLKAFQKFENTVEALSDITAPRDLEKELKKESLAVADSKLGGSIAKKFGIKVATDSAVLELYRGIRSQFESLLSGVPSADMNAMVLGLSHSLSRYKLKFSPDKVDTMIVQAIALLDDLDKELNTYAMRVKEWYGWHFPEMTRIVVDNLAYAKVVKIMDVLPEELEKEVKEAAEISMGTEVIISITDYRSQLYEYLKNRMNAIAPNLTTIVGELVGARLIHMPYPASTVQILGAEKALFRALKTKHDTPKYGLIFHASLVGQAAPKSKGKIARMVATKSSIAARVDALGEEENQLLIDARLRQLEGVQLTAKGAKNMRTQKKFEPKAAGGYNATTDFIMSTEEPAMEVDKPEEEKKEKKERRKRRKRKRRRIRNGHTMKLMNLTKQKQRKEEEEEEVKGRVDVESFYYLVFIINRAFAP